MGCNKCRNRRHVWSAGRGWERCDCLTPILDTAFITPAIRGKTAAYPAEFDSYDPYPLTDRTVGGSWAVFDAFKSMAWRSLAPLRETGLRYAYVDSYRLVDIYFERDELYPSVRLLADLDLLILTLGLADLPNKLLPGLLTQVLTLRRDTARPTWVFSPYSRGKVADVYGMAVAELVGEVSPVLPGRGNMPVAGNTPRTASQEMLDATAPVDGMLRVRFKS